MRNALKNALVATAAIVAIAAAAPAFATPDVVCDPKADYYKLCEPDINMTFWDREDDGELHKLHKGQKVLIEVANIEQSIQVQVKKKEGEGGEGSVTYTIKF